MGKITSWWESTDASYTMLGIIIVLLTVLWFSSSQQASVAEEKAQAAVSVIHENNESAVKWTKRLRADDKALVEFDNKLKEYPTDAECLDKPYPVDYPNGL
jgi:hypothetical protein